MRQSTKRSKKVEALLCSTFRENIATHYDLDKEVTTHQLFITIWGENGHAKLQVEKCVLFVSLETPWLAASPDGLVHDPAVSHSLDLVIEIYKMYTLFTNFLYRKMCRCPHFAWSIKKKRTLLY